MPETAAQGQPRDLGPGPAQKAKRAQAPACHWRPLAVAGCQWQRIQVVQVLPVTLRPQATLPGSEAGPRLLACHFPTCLCFPGGPGLPGPGPSESRQRHGGSEHASSGPPVSSRGLVPRPASSSAQVAGSSTDFDVPIGGVIRRQDQCMRRSEGLVAHIALNAEA
jgi:hypothetical protein